MAIASDNPFPSVLLVEGTTPTSPSSGQQRLFIDSGDHAAKTVDSSGTVTTLGGGGGGGGSVTVSSAVLTSDTAVANGSWTDVLSLSLAAGTYILMASAQLSNGSGGVATAGVRIANGSTDLGQGYSSMGAGFVNTCAISCTVVLGSTTTIKLQGQANASSQSVIAEAFDTDHTATQLLAIKIA